jgi:hypothetical protein
MPEKLATWYRPDDPTPRFQCPCCDYVTLPERKMYIICRVCFWEDDGQDIDDMDTANGANKDLTLRQARANFTRFGAFDRNFVSDVADAEERSQYEHRPRRIP